jgi:hypothetical protein
VVVLPTPPFWFATAKIRGAADADGSASIDCETIGCADKIYSSLLTLLIQSPKSTKLGLRDKATP